MNSFSFNSGTETNYDKQWAFEVAYFIQQTGTTLQNLGNLLNARDYVEARILATEMKQRAEYEKTLQPDFRTSDYFVQARRLFNSFLDECVNFAELLRITTIQEETGCEELLDKPEQIRNSIDRLNILKEMLTDELHIKGWY
ncbi:hypothetical protein MSSAC_3692 [Methanosarcina siciliae C2J]|uniref:Uncharacterized protein n=3 Tax=Methanosarcina siciliae TaxID=38027 RepID=A0A0E3PGN1_9EURY|nr:hypothetical protein [Methanosarcina siciliae]AKB30018.1 hypothetical protein MSSIT_3299 [Methanosarcina siciliae T4/M]AKB33918.1 hypothetical protein MSSIH_3228 [Methanosarcina siciliae HI350]AKB38282.1 hypothetical protein MSSAC_3692 [Methanosarcina siciliae C2J]